MKETELASYVVDWLAGQHWEVFPEVLDPEGSRVCDIYGRRQDPLTQRSPDLWAIEVKTRFSIRVMEQAFRWQQYAHFTSVAVPRAKHRSSARAFAESLCAGRGIGVIEVGEDEETGEIEVVELVQPNRHRLPKVPELNEAQKQATAGQAGGGHWTPFERTCERLVEHAENNPSVPLSVAVTNISHHYSSDQSAESSISSHVKSGKEALKDVRLQWKNGAPSHFHDHGGYLVQIKDKATP